MVKSSKGAFSGNTRKLRGKSITSVAQEVRTFKIGDKVVIKPRSTHRGLPHLRYSGKHGIVEEKRGKAYLVGIKDYKKKKTIIVGAVHLRLAQ